jgi:hypothetical protein
MADRLEIMPVEIEDERAVIIRMIMRAQAGRPVVLGPGLEGRFIEGPHLRSRLATCVGGAVLPSLPIQNSGLPPLPKPQAETFPVCSGVTSSTKRMPKGASACA